MSDIYRGISSNEQENLRLNKEEIIELQENRIKA